MRNLERYYADIKKRPSFAIISDPSMHIEG